MRPVLFLDFDGVLNTPATQHPMAKLASYMSHRRATSPQRRREGLPGITGLPVVDDVPESEAHRYLERPLVERLAGLVCDVQCDMVFHTGWIARWDTAQLMAFLRRAGFRTSHGCAFESAPNERGREWRIRSWLLGVDSRPFAVLDDCASRREFPTACQGRLVLVDGRVGLQDVDCARAKALMEERDDG